MMLLFDRKIKYLLGYFLLPLLVDRISKYLVVIKIIPDQQILPFFDIYLVYNRGVSFGVGSSGNLVQFILVSGMVAAIILGFCWYMYKTLMKSMALGACLMILSGAVSNFYDRLHFGGVVDFILLYWGDWWFPIFNMADVFIFIGACLLLYAQAKDEFCL